MRTLNKVAYLGTDRVSRVPKVPSYIGGPPTQTRRRGDLWLAPDLEIESNRQIGRNLLRQK